MNLFVVIAVIIAEVKRQQFSRKGPSFVSEIVDNNLVAAGEAEIFRRGSL